jgi:hypothetical protein
LGPIVSSNKTPEQCIVLWNRACLKSQTIGSRSATFKSQKPINWRPVRKVLTRFPWQWRFVFVCLSSETYEYSVFMTYERIYRILLCLKSRDNVYLNQIQLNNLKAWLFMTLKFHCIGWCASITVNDGWGLLSSKSNVCLYWSNIVFT